MGVVPSSMSVPLLLAIIILSQYSGSEVSDETMPNSGIWLITKKMSRVNCDSISVCTALVTNTSYPCPHQSLVEGDLRFGRRHLGEERREGLNQIEKSDCTS